MGWPFSPTYDRQVYTDVTSIFDAGAIIDDWKIIPIKAARAGVSVGTAFKSELLSGFGAKVSSAVRYAQNPDKYPLGLPSITGLHNSVGVSEIQAALNDLYANPIIDYHQFGGMSPVHAAYQELTDNYGYRESRNQLTTLSHQFNAPVYLEHITIELSEIAADENTIVLETIPLDRFLPFDNAYAQANILNLDPLIEGDEVRITFHYAYVGLDPNPGSATRAIWDTEGTPAAYQRLRTSQETVVLNQGNLTFGELYGYNFQLTWDDDRFDQNDFVKRGTVQLLLSDLGYDTDKSYFQTKFYYTQGSQQRIGYFTYEAGENTNPALEAAIALKHGQTDYMPWLFFRSKFENLADESLWDTDEYKQRVRLAARMGMDYQEYADLIHESPSIGEISQAFFCFGVPINTNEQYQMRYLHEFFYRRFIDEQFVNFGTTDSNYAAFMWYSQEFGNWTASRVGAYNVVVFSNLDVRMSLKYGGIDSELEQGRIGSIDHCSLEQTEYPYFYRIRQNVSVGDDKVERQWVVKTSTIPVLVIRRQITETVYMTLRIADPVMSYTLVDELGLRPIEAKVVLDDDTSEFLIPVSYTIANELFSGLKKQLFFKQSANIVKNAYVKTELEWYQASAFLTTITVVGVFLSLVSLGSASVGVKALYANLLTRVGPVAAAILTVTITIGTKVGLEKVFEYVAEELGADNAIYVSVLALVAASVAAYSGSPNTGYYLQAANGLQTATDEQIKKEIQSIQEEFNELVESESDFLQEIQDEIDAVADSRYLFAQIGYVNQGPALMEPQDFYNIKIHTQNIGALAVHSTDTMIQQLLALPTKTR